MCVCMCVCVCGVYRHKKMEEKISITIWMRKTALKKISITNSLPPTRKPVVWLRMALLQQQVPRMYTPVAWFHCSLHIVNSFIASFVAENCENEQKWQDEWSKRWLKKYEKGERKRMNLSMFASERSEQKMSSASVTIRPPVDLLPR